MDSMEVNNNILKQTGEPVEETYDEVRSKTSFEIEWVSPELSTSSHSTVPEPQPDSTFSPPPSASRSLSNAWSEGPCYPSNLSDHHTQSNSGSNNVAFTSPDNFNSTQSGYLLPCNTTDSLNYWRPEIIPSTSSDDVRQVSSSYSFAASRQLEENIRGDFIISQLGQVSTPSFQYHGVDSASLSSWDSSTISLPSPGSISSPLHELPTFMSPVETAKPCPQNCQCHGFTPKSLVNNHGNMIIHPIPDLLNTKPDQCSASGTTSTMCVTSPLVCPGPYQISPPTSFQPFRPVFVDVKGMDSASSTNSLSLVSSAPIVPRPSCSSAIQAGPHHDRQLQRERVYPVQVVKSDWMSSQDQGNVDKVKAIENEQNNSTTASMIMSPTLKTEHGQLSVPPLFVQPTAHNYDERDGDDLPLGTNNSASSHVSHNATGDYGPPPDYHESYHHTYPSRFPSELPIRPPSQYPSCPPVEYPTLLAAPDYPGRYTIQYHAQPTYQPHPVYSSSASDNPHTASILMSRLTSHSFSPFDDWRVGVQHRPDRRGFPSRDIVPPPLRNPAPATGTLREREKQPRRQRPPTRTGKRLVDMFPDILPVLAWCINYPQNTSSSSTKPSLTTAQIREIVIECVPGIKERGGIGKSTIMNHVHNLKKKMRNKVNADQTTATQMRSPVPSSTPLSSQENFPDHADRPTLPADLVSDFPVLKENSAEHQKATVDAISSSTTYEDDNKLPRAPTEPILRSLIKFVDDVAKAEKPSKLTPSLKTSKSASMIAVRNNVWHQRELDNEAHQKSDLNTATTIGYDSDTGASMFRSLLEAHDIAVDEVKRMRTSDDTLYPAPSAFVIERHDGSNAKSPIKSSNMQPEVALPEEKIEVATNSTKFNDHELDDVMVIVTVP